MNSSSEAVNGVLLFAALCVLRIFNALLIQTQFDPDEYWQTLEPAYCEAFPQRPCAYTWEWMRRTNSIDDSLWTRCLEGPIRSYLSVLPTYIFYEAVKRWQWDSIWIHVVTKGPLLLHAVLVAAPTDFATWYMGKWSSSKQSQWRTYAWSCLLCSVTSWFNGYALIRTYSNSYETMLLSLGIALVSPELFGKGASWHSFRASIAFVLGGLSVAIRFTSLAAWIPLGILLAFQQYKSILRIMRYLFVPCALFGLVGIGLSLLVDRYFYGFWTVPFLGSLHFNVVLGLGSLYGTHPLHWYLSAGIPAITGLLFPLVVYDAWTLPRGASAAQRNTWIIIVSYTLLHSCSAHKEFRFLLPILPLFCVRAGHVIARSRLHHSRLFWLLLVIPNLVAVLYLGTFHQGAPIQVNRRIRQFVHHSADDRGVYSVHYLMGCHSTPLYSHLHVPNREIQAWTLDCSPSCRLSSDCESDDFSKNPVEFVQQSYNLDDTTCRSDEGDAKTCASKSVPDFLVMYSEVANGMQDLLAGMGLVEVDRFAHALSGVRLGSMLDVGNDDSRRVRYLGVEFRVEDMILFAQENSDFATLQ